MALIDGYDPRIDAILTSQGAGSHLWGRRAGGQSSPARNSIILLSDNPGHSRVRNERITIAETRRLTA
jgi:hypothetical protein